jgi:hypothetical protein
MEPKLTMILVCAIHGYGSRSTNLTIHVYNGCKALLCVMLPYVCHCVFMYIERMVFYRLKIAACWHKCIDGQVRLVHLVRLLTDNFRLFFINKQKNNKLPQQTEK